MRKITVLIDDKIMNINLLQEMENGMETATVENDLLKLPEKIAKRLRGRRIEISEIKEGVLLKPATDPIAEAKGFLKGKRFTTKRYIEMKITEKELES